jgi:hypothetical protein
VISGDADGGPLGAGHHVRSESEALNFFADPGDVLLGGVGSHYD